MSQHNEEQNEDRKKKLSMTATTQSTHQPKSHALINKIIA